MPWPPVISAETLDYHYGKHHQAYVTNLNKLIEGKPEANESLEAIDPKSATAGVFNNAAQVWNHTFYWNSMKPDGGGKPTGALLELINRDFGSTDKFAAAARRGRQDAVRLGLGLAGAGRRQAQDRPTTANADLPMKHGQNALLTIDVWEHAYYIDYRNARPKYVEAFPKSLVNWDFASKNLEVDERAHVDPTAAGALTRRRRPARRPTGRR